LALPYLVGRFEKGDEVELPARRRMTATPTDHLRRIWYDCITYDLGALEYLVSVAGADRVLFGTDWPHQVHAVKESLANTASLPPDQRDAIRGGNRAAAVRDLTPASSADVRGPVVSADPAPMSLEPIGRQ
jgi:aminocarboxymuconate-semialdehyde decarboxylase